MPTAAPTGLLSTPIALLADMLAHNAAFQAWVGASNAATAHERMHIYATARNPEQPFCLLDISDGFTRTRDGITNGVKFSQDGAITAYFRAAVDPAHNDTEAAYTFSNHLGAVWADLETMAGAPDALPITSISLILQPTRSTSDRRKHTGDVYEAALAITWGATR